MALKKSKLLGSRVTADYWRVTHFRLDATTALGEVRLGLYLDAAARAAGADELTYLIVTLPGFATNAMASAGGPVALAYTKLKNLDEFGGSEDV